MRCICLPITLTNSTRLAQAPACGYMSKTHPASAEPKGQDKSLMSRIKWVNLIALALNPLVGGYGALSTPLLGKTLLWSVFLYAFAMLGKSSFKYLTNAIVNCALGVTAGMHECAMTK